MTVIAAINKTIKTTFETIVIGWNGINYDCLFFCDQFLFAKNVLEFKLTYVVHFVLFLFYVQANVITMKKTEATKAKISTRPLHLSL